MTGAVEGRLAEAWTKVRALHQPVWTNWLGFGVTFFSQYQCGECLRRWPCKTAEIVFNRLERAAALAGTPPEDEADK